MKKAKIKIIIYQEQDKTKVKLKSHKNKNVSDGVNNLYLVLKKSISDLLNKI